MSRSEKKIRWIITIITTVAISVCVVVSETCNINTPLISIIGGYAAIPAVLLLTWKLPQSFFIGAMTFVIFAPGLGTIVNLYRTIDSYDRIIHFLSGLILAEAGRILILRLFKRYGIGDISTLVILFVVLFSCMGAGLWEIYEFTGDQLLATKMQGDNLNTMGDIVSGFLGAAVYAIGYFAAKSHSCKRKLGEKIV